MFQHLLRRYQHLYQVQLAHHALRVLLKALYSHLVALTALLSLLQSGGSSHLLLQLLLLFQMIRSLVPSLDEDMEEVQFAGAVSTSDPYNLQTGPFKQR